MRDNNSNNEFKELDDFFVESLENASVKPSKNVWQSIEKNLDEKKKKRYLFWLLPSLILLIIGALGTYFFLPLDLSTTKTAETNSSTNSTVAIIPTQSSTETNATKNEKNSSTEKNDNLNSSEKNKTTTKIQLAAVKNLTTRLPDQIGEYEVRSEIGSDNIKRFFVEVPEEKISASIATLKNAGYADAFVKDAKQTQNTLAKTNNANSTNTPFATTKNEIIAVTISRNKKPVSENSSNFSSTDKVNTSETSAKTNSFDNSATGIVALNDNNKTPTNAKEEISIKKEEPVTPVQQIITNTLTPTNTVSTSNETIESITKIDSVKKENKSEVAAIPPSLKQNDSLPPTLNKDPKFALYILGGPVITQTFPSPKFSSEFSAVTYNAGLKFQFLPFKKIAIELGVNYQKCSSQSKEDTLGFSKLDPSDSQFHSSLGDMAVSYSNMINGFNVIAPINTFHVKYNYKINYSVINIPVAVKFYPIKKDKLAVSIFAAANSQIVMNSRSQLIVHKENWDEVYNYNNIPGKKFNLSLMLGFGCEFKLRKHLYFVVEPGVRYYLTNLNSNAGIRSNRLNFDGNAGFKFPF